MQKSNRAKRRPLETEVLCGCLFYFCFFGVNGRERKQRGSKGRCRAMWKAAHLSVKKKKSKSELRELMDFVGLQGIFFLKILAPMIILSAALICFFKKKDLSFVWIKLKNKYCYNTHYPLLPT